MLKLLIKSGDEATVRRHYKAKHISHHWHIIATETHPDTVGIQRTSKSL